MGGVGKRFGSDTPKQFHRLAGKMVFLHTLDAFLATHLFDEIVLSCHPDWIETIKPLIPAADCPIRLVSAGKTRQESSHNGILGFQQAPDVVVIHDAVRPFVSSKILFENVQAALQTGAVDTCIPSADTLVHAPDHEKIAAIPPRSEYLRGQTPQSFSYPLILDAHKKTKRTDASDDCQLIMDIGHPIAIVPGDEHNLKITSELDLFYAEQLLRLHISQIPKHSKNTLAHKRYAIVGGTGGIGSAIKKQIVSLGGEAICLARNTKPFSLDLQDADSITRAFEHLGLLDGLINCAGYLSIGSIKRQSLSDIKKSIDVNLLGLIYSCKMARLKKGAHVINIASSSFSRGRKDTSIYSSSKAGVVNFTQGFAEERLDLHVHAVIPQRTNTPMRRQNFPGEDISTLLDPEDVAEAVVNLLHDHDRSGLLIDVRKK